MRKHYERAEFSSFHTMQDWWCQLCRASSTCVCWYTILMLWTVVDYLLQDSRYHLESEPILESSQNSQSRIIYMIKHISIRTSCFSHRSHLLAAAKYCNRHVGSRIPYEAGVWLSVWCHFTIFPDKTYTYYNNNRYMITENSVLRTAFFQKKSGNC